MPFGVVPFSFGPGFPGLRLFVCVSPIPFWGWVQPFGVWSLGFFAPLSLSNSVLGFPGFTSSIG